MPGKPLTPVEIGQIDAYRNCGKNIGEIALIMGKNRRTISRFIKKWRECSPGKVPVHKERPGKKRLINEHASRVMARAFLKSPRKPCKQLKIEYPELFGDIKVRTLQDHACRRLEFKSRVARKKPLLTPAHIQKRLKFARMTKKWTAAEWRRVLWSDEASFKVCGTLPKKVRRPKWVKGQIKGSPHQRQYLVPTVKFAQKIMVWACMSGNAGRGSFVVIPKGKTVTAKSYLDILKEKLGDTMEIHDTLYFMQDGAPVHTAKIVKEWFKSKNIEVFDWPPQSPDLNPIENMWHYMKRQLENYDTSSLTKLESALKDVWCRGLALEQFVKYADSMPKRIEEVIKNQGGHTSY